MDADQGPLDSLEPTPKLPPLPQLPPKVAKAISDVMFGIAKLEKDANNPHANYKYAGIESFLEMVRPLCAQAGLIIIQDEESYEFREATDKYGKPLTWLVMVYSFGLAHSSGETWSHRIRRTGMVQASMGSQAFGAAQSYALKSFLRSIELIATGDSEDADSHAQSELPPRTAKAKRDEPVRFNSEESASYTEALLTALVKLKSATSVDDFAKENAGLYGRLIPEHQQTVREATNMRRAELTKEKAKAKAEAKTDEGAESGPN